MRLASMWGGSEIHFARNFNERTDSVPQGLDGAPGGKRFGVSNAAAANGRTPNCFIRRGSTTKVRPALMKSIGRRHVEVVGWILCQDQVPIFSRTYRESRRCAVKRKGARSSSL